MARKITKATLAELAQEMSILSEQDQHVYFGGGNGSSFDPYTYEEYQNLVLSGSWYGGYVQGSFDTYTADGSGNWIRNAGSVAVYLPAEAGSEDYTGGGVSGNYSWADSSGNIISGNYHDWMRNNYPNGITYTSLDSTPNEGMYPNIPAPSDWGSSGGDGGSPSTTSGVPEEIRRAQKYYTFDRSFSGSRMQSIFDKFLNADSFNRSLHFDDTIKHLSEAYTLRFDLQAFSHTSRRGETLYTTHFQDTNEVTVRLNLNHINTGRPERALATTLLHELYHADLYRIIEKYSSYFFKGRQDRTLEPDLDVIRSFHRDLVNSGKRDSETQKEIRFLNHIILENGDIEQAQHEMMAEDVPSLATDLQGIFGGNTYNYQYTLWKGLMQTKAYSKLHIDDQTRIYYFNITNL